MAVTLSSLAAVAMCNAFTALINQGSAVDSGYFRIYAGAVPANARAALVGENTLLVELDCSADAFADAVANDAAGYAEAQANTIPEAVAVGTGTATFFRHFDRDNRVVYQGTVSLPNGGGQLELSNTAVTAEINTVIQSYAITYPM